MASRSNANYVGSVICVMLASGACAVEALRWFGPGILWRLPFLIMMGIPMVLVSVRCPGGRGLVRCIRGAVALTLGCAGMILLSLMFSIFYQVLLAFLGNLPGAAGNVPAVEMYAVMGVTFLAALFMDFIFAAEFVDTVHAVFRPPDENRIQQALM